MLTGFEMWLIEQHHALAFAVRLSSPNMHCNPCDMAGSTKQIQPQAVMKKPPVFCEIQCELVPRRR